MAPNGRQTGAEDFHPPPGRTHAAGPNQEQHMTTTPDRITIARTINQEQP